MQGRVPRERRVVAGVVDIFPKTHDAHDRTSIAFLLDDGDIDVQGPGRQRVVMNSDGARAADQVLRYSCGEQWAVFIEAQPGEDRGEAGHFWWAVWCGGPEAAKQVRSVRAMLCTLRRSILA